MRKKLKKSKNVECSKGSSVISILLTAGSIIMIVQYLFGAGMGIEDRSSNIINSNISLHAHPESILSAVFITNSSENIEVDIEDFGKRNPLDVFPHGPSIRFFKINSQNLSSKSITINVSYCDMDVKDIDEERLAIFRYEPDNSTWVMLPTTINREKNKVKASSDTLSIFAVSSTSSHPENNSSHSHEAPQMSQSHNCAGMGDKSISASLISSKSKITLEIESKNDSSSYLPEKPITFFRIDADGIPYSRVDIKMTYNDDMLNGANESDLSILHYANSTWEKLPVEISEDENTLMTSTRSLSLFAMSIFFKNDSHMSMGNISNCLFCHKSSNNTFKEDMGMIQKINESTFGLGIHANLNNASLDMNRACWACHSGSADPPKKHPPMHRPSSLACSVCHVNGSDKFNSLQTSEHTTDGSNISVNATCQVCHGKTQMIYQKGKTLNSTISHYGKKRSDMLDGNSTGTDCSYCHQNASSEFWDVFRNTSRTDIMHNGGLGCSSCHGTGRLHNSSLKNMQGYNLSRCMQCHGKKGFAISRVSRPSINKGIHANLNNAGSGLNRACWACHSNILSAPDDHPNVTRPSNSCSRCHIEGALNLTGKQNGEAHISFHDAQSKETGVPACILCHDNDLFSSGKTINSSVSHYSRYPNIDTMNCVFCHQNKEIGKKWGAPSDPRETIPLSKVEKRLVSDEIWKINQNYSIAVSEIDRQGKSVRLELYYDGVLIRKELIPEGGSFTYDKKLVQGGDNKTIIDLRIVEIFYGGLIGLVTFEGSVPEHIHTETGSEQCYTCHVKDYRPDRPEGYRFLVLDKDGQNVRLNPIDIDFGPAESKIIYTDNSWDLGSGHKLSLMNSGPDRENVRLILTQNDIIVKEELVRKGEYFSYNTYMDGKDITILKLKIADLFIKG